MVSGAAICHGSRPASDTGQASVLIERADRLNRRADLTEKARLYEEAAALLPDQDFRVSHVLMTAGTIAGSLGRTGHALLLLERSADLATRRGAIVEAADTYVAALFLALRVGDRASARRFMDRAIFLTGSANMPDAERVRILQRISQPAKQLSPLTQIEDKPTRLRDR